MDLGEDFPSPTASPRPDSLSTTSADSRGEGLALTVRHSEHEVDADESRSGMRGCEVEKSHSSLGPQSPAQYRAGRPDVSGPNEARRFAKSAD